MKQLLQYPGQTTPGAVNVPDPQPMPGRVLIRTRASLISSGTERASVQLARASLVQKARQRPEAVRQVIAKARTEGMRATWEKVRHRLAEPLVPGYSASGSVIGCGENVDGFRAGDRVAAAGQDHASHAEIISVPKNLVCRLPDSLSFPEGAFVAVGAIALHGARCADVHIGETVAVIGLGLVGQLTCQLLDAHGCRVIGIDPDPSRRELAQTTARALTAFPETANHVVQEATAGVGADAVVMCAASDSASIMAQAADLARDRGTIVVVGAVPMDVPRTTFYRKELQLRISRSYGPGRYDDDYEVRGIDYPLSYVRWTENRNMRAFLDLVAQRRVDVAPLITHRYDLTQSEEAYRTVEESRLALAVVFEYPELTPSEPIVRRIVHRKSAATKDVYGVGFWGAGAFAGSVLAPIFRARRDVRLVGVAAQSSVSADKALRRHRFAYATCRGEDLLGDADIDIVVIVTPHRDHAAMAQAALAAGKIVFLEKPAATDREELRELAAQVAQVGGHLQVGFNRRYSPAAQQVRAAFALVSGPKTISYRINAGPPPQSGWLADPAQGGRLIGEVCHFADTILYLTGSWPKRVMALPQGPCHAEGVVILLELMDGSTATITYATDGSTRMPKEYVEIMGGGQTAVIDDYSRWSIRTADGTSLKRRQSQDKGHAAQIVAMLDHLKRERLVAGDWAAAISATEITFAANESLETGRPIEIEPWF